MSLKLGFCPDEPAEVGVQAAPSGSLRDSRNAVRHLLTLPKPGKPQCSAEEVLGTCFHERMEPALTLPTASGLRNLCPSRLGQKLTLCLFKGQKVPQGRIGSFFGIRTLVDLLNSVNIGLGRG